MSELKTTSLSHKDNNTGTPNITMYPDGTTSLPGTVLAGFRNQLINGNMLIGQRGRTDVVDWTADRWRGLNTHVRYYVSEQGQFRRSIGPLANDRNIVQPIELQFTGSRGVFQEGSQWTFSLYTSSAAPAAALYFSTASFAGTDLLNTPITLTSTGESEGNLSRWSGTVTLPSGSIGSSTCLVLSIAVQNGEVFVGCQLEPGPVATPFEHRPIGTELALCQRYYFQHPENIITYVYTNREYRYREYNFPTTMRVVPTLTFGINTNWKVDTLSRGATVDGFYVDGFSNDQARTTYIGQITADAEL